MKNEKEYKQQIASLEEQVHSNYVKMRTAIRECDEHKREKEVYRKRLLDIDVPKSFSAKSSTPLGSKAGSERAVSPTNSNKSSEFVAFATLLDGNQFFVFIPFQLGI